MNDYFKYPKTLHLPWSEGVNDDDKVQYDLSSFEGEEVVITSKMDGENSSVYTNHYHARSLDSQDHWTRNYMQELQKRIGSNIPNGWRICGENLYAKHSIGYDDLVDYFLVFSIWNEQNICLSWDDTKDWCVLLGLHWVPVLYEGTFDEKTIRNYILDTSKMEGYVIRLKKEFKYEDFSKSVVKWVRKDHVQTGSKHWMYSNVKIEKNKLIYFKQT